MSREIAIDRLPHEVKRALHVTLYPMAKLPPAIVNEWQSLVEADQRYRSPFFRYDMTEQISRVRPAAEIASLSDSGGNWLGVFPFERLSKRRGGPVGGIFSDYHGVISHGDVCAAQLHSIVQQCRLKSYRFHHVPAEQTAFLSDACYQEPSPIVDLSGGLDGYRNDLKQRGSHFLKRMGQRSRKLTRDIGPIELQMSADETLYHEMCDWKRQVCRAQRRSNVYDQKWSVSLFRNLLQLSERTLRGRVVVLRAGGQQIGMAYVIQSSHHLHVWKIAVNPEFFRYSPGLLVLYHLILQSPEWQIDFIDFARGDERFKTTLQNGEQPVVEGWVGGSAWLKQGRRLWLQSKKRFRGSALERPAKQCVRWFRQVGSNLSPTSVTDDEKRSG